MAIPQQVYAIALSVFITLGGVSSAIAREQPASVSTMWDVSNLIAEGRKEMRLGNPEKALPLFEKARQLNPNFATAIALVAQAKAYDYWRVNHFGTVYLKLFEAGIKSFPSPKMSAHLTYLDGMKIVENALKIDPRNEEALLARIMVHRTILDVEAMEADLSLIPNSQSSLTQTLWGDVYFFKIASTPTEADLEQLALAQNHYRRALKIDSDLFQAWVGLGDVFLKIRNFKEVLAIGQKLTSLNSSRHEGYVFTINGGSALNYGDLVKVTKRLALDQNVMTEFERDKVINSF